MNTFRVRTLTSETITSPVTYPFYRMEVQEDNRALYWKFINGKQAILLIREGARTTIINYRNCDTDHTPLTADLLRGHGKVDCIDANYYKRVRNEIVTELLEANVDI